MSNRLPPHLELVQVMEDWKFWTIVEVMSNEAPPPELLAWVHSLGLPMTVAECLWRAYRQGRLDSTSRTAAQGLALLGHVFTPGRSIGADDE